MTRILLDQPRVLAKNRRRNNMTIWDQDFIRLIRTFEKIVYEPSVIPTMYFIF